MIQIHPFEEKKNEKGERISQFDGLWKVPMLDD